jgi:CRP/FNR family cyclic AMP-dependent transcriptional regulator
VILSQHPFFKDLDPQKLQFIAGCASNVRFEEGKFLFRDGEDANNFYVIRAGKVAIEIFSPKRGAITIQTLREGDVLGWSWLFPPYRWHFDAKALELTRAISLDGKCLRNKCEEDHDIGYELMKRFSDVIIQRLQATRIQVLDLYAEDG